MVDCPMACCLPLMKPCIFKKGPPNPKSCACCDCPMNCILDCFMACPCCATSETGGMASPCMAKMMQPLMRYMMNALMQVTEHENDPTYKEIQNFMNPTSVGKPFVDAPGTFTPGMEPRYKETGFGMFGVRLMTMERVGMKAAGSPHDKGITWEKFCEHRGYAAPGYEPKHPKDGEKAIDGKIFAIDGSGATSTLLAEAKKVAEAAGSDKVIICFDGMTCPFYRAYCMEDLYRASNGCPKLHVYIREAEPCDEFDAGGMHMVTPLKMKRPIPVHKTAEDRAKAANDCKTFLEKSAAKAKVNMWMDGMDDTLEAAYEARPWRWYVVDIASGTVITSTGLAPFNMKGKLAKIKEATATGSKYTAAVSPP